VELLVAVAILAALAAMLLPSLAAAHALTESAVCKANIRLLQLGNQVYARDHDGYYAPGAPYMYPLAGHYDDPRINNILWYGRRERGDKPFSRDGGPLSGYLPGQLVKGCPTFREFRESFEAGCGGYGYNNNFVGRHVVPASGRWYRPADRYWHLTGNDSTNFRHPDETVAFTDTAFVSRGLIEYSFCESPTWPVFGGQPRPSIHFRHLERTNVVWLDGHVSDEPMAFSNEVATGSPYSGSPAEHNVGWFGPEDNRLFDCK
jgi:prepilin-type processing-associated H-X9-DG protein